MANDPTIPLGDIRQEDPGSDRQGAFKRGWTAAVKDLNDDGASSKYSALLNARQRQNQYYDIRFFTGSYALSADSKIGRFNFSGFTQWSKHQFHKIPHEE
ncbi:hypothetical protein [Natronomonas moolapensis]|uniref:hypothetical protein n=1 Tax=Natronomonas moolapensis TaxID=416273 RepID=UPI00126022CC|nr:hypothetical protein [Natronomonas moolapensis]